MKNGILRFVYTYFLGVVHEILDCAYPATHVVYVKHGAANTFSVQKKIAVVKTWAYTECMPISRLILLLLLLLPRKYFPLEKSIVVLGKSHLSAPCASMREM